jgi:hypothetical protein
MRVTLPAWLLAAAFGLSPAYAGSCVGSNQVHSPQAMAEKYFDQMDANRDTIVTKAEFEASEMASMIKSFDVLGPDENGEVRKPAFIKSFMEAHAAHRTEA